ncbi:MAG: aminotransferase class IV [Saccharofermentanales bacterium]
MDNEDFGILYGFGLFETFFVDRRGKVFLLEKHVNRILASAKHFGIDADVGALKLQTMIMSHIAENEIADSVLRVTITAGNKNKGIKSSVLFSGRKNVYTPDVKSKGCRICLSDVRKSPSSLLLAHKTSNYLENHLLLQEAAARGFDDMLFLNTDGYVTETCKSNIFFVKNGILCTPDLSCGLLSGIIREWVIGKAAAKGIAISEGRFRQDDIFSADEVFVTNSVMGIFYVSEIGGTKLSGEITGILSDELVLEMGSGK